MMLSDRYRTALVFAFDLHRNQSRKGSGVPYVAHILGVSSSVLEQGGDEDLAIAALLHDAVEDQGGAPTAEEIRRQFGDRVANVVLECTNPESGGSWTEKKEVYLAKLAHVSDDATLVAACDKLYNLRAIVSDLASEGESVWSRFSGGKAGVIWYYRELETHLKFSPAVGREFSAALAELLSFGSQELGS